MDYISDINNPKPEEILNLLAYVKEMVKNDNFTVLPRPKNINFFDDYMLNPDIFVPEVVMNLSISDFCECEPSDNQDQPGLVYIFSITRELTDFEDYTEPVEIYIKFSCEDEDAVIFISFHDAEHDMYTYQWSNQL